MDRLFNSKEEYQTFLMNLSTLVGYIEYEFIFEFDHEAPNLVNKNILDKFKASDESLIETHLLNLIFSNRILITIESADFSNEYHRIKKITILSVMDDETIEGLKEYEIFYTIEEEYMSDEYRKLLENIVQSPIRSELQEVINRKYFGDVTIGFLDKEQIKIIDILCHEGAYLINEEYKSLLN